MKTDVERARETAVAYCEKNGLSVEKFLSDSRCSYDDENCHFLRFPVEDTQGLGLYVDLETQGVPVLIVHSNGTVEETEYTRQYLTEEGNV